MPQFNFDAVWNTLTETDKRRIVAIWCCEQPTKVDWDFVAKATSSAHGGAARKANGKLLTKLRDGGAVEDGNDAASESDKRRIVAMWALDQPAPNWQAVAESMGSVLKPRTMYYADNAFRKKLNVADAEPEETDWAKVTEAAAGGQATVASVKTYHSRTLKKLKDAGAELDEDGSPVGGASSDAKATTPKPTPKKKAAAGEKKAAGGGRKRKAKEDIPVDSVEEEPVTKKVKEEIREEVDGDGEEEQVI
ncbi:hypothetical protein W97_03085 [Coniosporium apollinis CBS 100218]|uniref:Uncharacterized protein n=1 Tax=Coniosporium apollinis (strain CBS 100218) TaxID=1168221 RepID=R7YPM8_CONA1|nr:uncharacterized protein W97_03085 [Coniosporium apollinis CBS 100218]EON63857.1 hypothetical protein W97_03085 [Coniosporium apollinis CBS 100218]